MSLLCSTNNLLPVGLILVAGLLCASFTASSALSFEELLSLAQRLESSENLGNQLDEKRVRQQQNLLYSFTKEPKSSQCLNYFEQAKDRINQFHVKAQLFVEESKRGNRNWFGGMFGPLNALRGVARFDPGLEKLVELYQSNPKALTEQVITCDLANFLVRLLDNILFVYSTDVKTLVTGERALVNRAILDQLNKDNLVSRVNFYEFEKPTERQQKALLEYLGSIVDPSSIQIRDALNHYLAPGQFILGRTMDTCMLALEFIEHWLKVTGKAQCTGSRVSRLSLSSSIDSAGKYEHLAKFCHEMLDVGNDDS